jgi:hypothetical protein
MLYKLLCAGVVAMGLIAASATAADMMVVHHTVANYATWRPAFDADKTNQVAAGLTDPHVYQSVGNPNNITITFDMADPAKAKAFGTSKTLMATMKKAGVVGKPQVSYLVPAP